MCSTWTALKSSLMRHCTRATTPLAVDSDISCTAHLYPNVVPLVADGGWIPLRRQMSERGALSSRGGVGGRRSYDDRATHRSFGQLARDNHAGSTREQLKLTIEN